MNEECFRVSKIQKLEQELKELKLEKRQLLLAGKKTEIVDGKICLLENEIKSLVEEVNIN